MKTRFTAWLVGMMLLHVGVEQMFAQGTAFVYHGQLSQRGRPARGEHDLRFELFSAPTNGKQIARREIPDVRVQDGEFTVSLDFGPGIFDGTERWLEISVKQRHGDFTALKPRQRIMPVPYAIMANTASNLLGKLPASQIAGPIPANQLSGSLPTAALSGTYSAPLNLDNTGNHFTGDGSQLAKVNAASLNGLSASNFWQLGGNAGTTAGANSLGTTDNQPLELKVNSLRAFRVEPGSNGAPNVIGGNAGNVVGQRLVLSFDPPIIHYYPTGICGATISGGGTTNATNIIASHFGLIGGGAGNVIESIASYSTIAGGCGNEVPTGGGQTGAYFAFVGGGVSNKVHAFGGVISGGINNQIGAQQGLADFEIGNTIGGGVRNYVGDLAPGGSTIGGGIANGSRGPGNTIAGGISNKIFTASSFSGHNAIGGGAGNYIDPTYLPFSFNPDAGYSVVAGGYSNYVEGSFAMIAGGMANAATHLAFAAGRQAKANHLGSFVWADCNEFDFPSTATNEFSVRAIGGVRFISAIDANGTPAAGVELPAGGGAWATLSDRDSKENFTPIDPREMLERVDRLSIQTWNYKSQDARVRHIGPIAQDFAAAFQVGESDRRITTVDADGVALAAIQGLNQVVKEKDAQIRQLQERIERLEQFMDQQNGGQR